MSWPALKLPLPSTKQGLHKLHSEGHPHTEGTFTGTLVNLGDLRRNSGECQGAYPEYDVVGSPKFAKLRHASPKFA